MQRMKLFVKCTLSHRPPLLLACAAKCEFWCLRRHQSAVQTPSSYSSPPSLLHWQPSLSPLSLSLLRSVSSATARLPRAPSTSSGAGGAAAQSHAPPLLLCPPLPCPPSIHPQLYTRLLISDRQETHQVHFPHKGPPSEMGFYYLHNFFFISDQFFCVWNSFGKQMDLKWFAFAIC